MPGIGTLVNALAVVIGGTIGTFVGDGIPARIHERVLRAMGLGVIVIGLFGSYQGLTKLTAASEPLAAYGVIVIIGALVFGTIIGELIDIETQLDRLGKMLGRLVPRKADTDEHEIAEGFVSASLIYCVGAMTILGALQDGLGNPQILYLKSLLDGVTSIFLAASLGVGVVFSALAILVVQGLIAALAFFAGAVVPEIVIIGIEAVGGVLIMGVGLGFATEKRLNIGNMLPAIPLVMLACWILG